MTVFDADLLTQEEIQRLVGACSKTSFTGVRNSTLIVLLWRTGLRISESLTLRPKDVDLRSRSLVVQRGKGQKRRVVGLDAPTVVWLEAWREKRGRQIGEREAPLFCTTRGKQIDSSYIRHLLPRLAEAAGIEKRVHAHGLRHRFAIDLVTEGAPVTTVRDLLGHSSIAITDTYLRRIGVGEAIEFSRSRAWALCDSPPALPHRHRTAAHVH